MAIKSIEWYVSSYSLTYHNPFSRKTITKDFDQEEDLIEFLNRYPKIRQFSWNVDKHLHAIIEED